MLQVCYSPQYFAQTHTNSMEKLTAVAEALKPLGIANFHEPHPLSIESLKQLHAGTRNLEMLFIKLMQDRFSQLN